ncbi:hypothetical protein AVEN_104214-1 [Araneus ventricosus]|uniref:Uncharacterized protein n=1 Tax=Araneus ventricosus TaxID=182803 RepID=A0A4Y2JVU3_ARAVE|nr:hypothetical protein AVEN_104214-1 [Araneus ventricosus]
MIPEDQQRYIRCSLIRASTRSGDPEVHELPSARRYILASELSQSSTFDAPVFDHRSCPFLPSMSDSNPVKEANSFEKIKISSDQRYQPFLNTSE